MAQLLLIVDADPGFTDPIRTAFEVQGVTVEVSDDAPLELMRKLRPSVLLLSVELPKGPTTGLSICSRIRRDRDLKNTRILLTSSTQNGDTLRKHAQSSDRADDYAQKTLEMDEVIARVGRLLQDALPRESQDLTRPPSLPSSGTTGDLSRPPNLPPSLPPSATGDLARPSNLSSTGDLARPPRLPGSDLGRPPSLPGADRGRSSTGDLGAAEISAPAVVANDSGSGDLERGTRDIRPPSLPPDLSRRPGAQPARPPKKEHIGAATTLEELWRTTRLDEALRALTDLGPEPQTPPKASPEERLTFLRQLVKYHESRDKAFRDAWEKVQAQGQELARRTLMLGLDLGSKDRKLEELQAERASTERRLHAVEEEFRAFQAEITRIFHEKDAEEQQTFAKVAKLEAANAALTADFNAAVERNRDHERRFRILQDEIDGQAAENEATDRRVVELEAALAAAENERETLHARLSTTEAVAAERADEVARLEERLDRLAIETAQEKRRLEEAAAAREREFAEELETVQLQHRDALAALERRNQHTLDRHQKEHGAVVASLQAERDVATSRNESLADTVAELERRLETLAQELEGVSRERDRVRRDLENNANDMVESLGRIETLEATLDDERAARRSETLQLEGTLEAERAAFAQARSELEMQLEAETKRFEQAKAELEEQVENAERETFERMLEVGRKAAEAEKATARVGELEQQLEARQTEAVEQERALERERSQRASLDSERSRLQAELANAEEQLRALEQERHARDARDAQETGRLRAQLDDVSAREREARAAREQASELLSRLATLVAGSAQALEEALGLEPPKSASAERPPNEDPFASLLADLERSNQEGPMDLEPGFEGASTASESPASPPPRARRANAPRATAPELPSRLRKRPLDVPEDEVDDRNVTEIVRIDRLK